MCGVDVKSCSVTQELFPCCVVLPTNIDFSFKNKITSEIAPHILDYLS
jgi:hypothetical protein